MSINKAEEIGVKIPNILLPSNNVNLNKWSVVACDQYTSQINYWEEVDRLVQDSPSTLRITFPEVYLECSDADARINSINNYMNEYLSTGILEDVGPCFIYVERTTAKGKVRKGLVMAIDLECYNYEKGSCALTRATEGTVLERIPPRMKIRKDASIELPHIMLLIDDPDKKVIEPLSNKVSNETPIYDFDLMMNGGHVKGYKIASPKLLNSVIDALHDLSDPALFRKKYNLSSNDPVLLFAVGDGNHSLASAKGHWNAIKKNLTEEEQKNHPARYALVEVVNVHDDGLVFEPIHRVLFNVKTDELFNEMEKYFSSKNSTISFKSFNTISEAEQYAAEYRISAPKGTHHIVFCSGKRFGVIEIENSPHSLEVGALQDFLDASVQSSSMKIDYIHGSDVVEELSAKADTLGFLLPVMHKYMFFEAIIKQGVLPRKTFSMGEAEEKRFYLECRKIK